MTQGEAIRIWNACCMRVVGVCQDEQVESEERLGLVAIGAGLPTWISASPTTQVAQMRLLVATWLREFADAIEAIDTPRDAK